MDQEEQWLNVDEAAKYLGVSRRAVYRYVQIGKLKAFKTSIGDRTVFKLQDLDEFKRPKPAGPMGKD